jgi:hypothetical protein
MSDDDCEIDYKSVKASIDGSQDDAERGGDFPIRRSKGGCCGPESWKKWTWCGIVMILLITIVTIIPLSLQKLSSTEFGIEYTPYSKKLDDAAKTGGLHTGPPGFSFIKFPSTFLSEDLPRGTCVSQDGLRVDYKVTFQYQIMAENLLPAIFKYRNFATWSKAVSSAGTSAIQHTCSEFEISNFQNQRGVIQARMEDNLRDKLDGSAETGDPGVYALVIALQLQNVDIPEDYQKAVEEKQAAVEAIALAQNQRVQSITQANTALLSAREEARKINDTAVNEASIVLTKAGLQAEETTFAFVTEAEVLVGAKASFNLTTEGVLAYVSNRLYAQVPRLTVTSSEPARLSRKDEL